MKKIISIIIISLLLTGCTSAKTHNITVHIDGKTLNMTDVNGNKVYPIEQSGTTYVPIRAISQALGYDIDWDGNNQNVFIYKNVENKKMIDFNNKGDEVHLFVDNIMQCLTDVKGSPVKPFVKDGTTYVPVRGVSQALGCTVNWNPKTSLVSISSAEREQILDANWASEYLDIIEEEYKDYDLTLPTTMYLIYIDDDDIPELYIDRGSYAGGGSLFTYQSKKKSIVEQHISNYGLSYVPRMNLFVDSGGHMDSYYDYVYTIDNGKFVKKHKGTYGADNYQAAKNWQYTYYWNDTEVSKEKYESNLNSVFDKNKAVRPYEDDILYSSMCKSLSEFANKKSNGFTLSKEQTEVLIDCANRLNECRETVGSENFASDFIRCYYTGKNPEKAYMKNGWSFVNWPKKLVRNDYMTLFGEEMPNILELSGNVEYSDGYYIVPMPGETMGDYCYRGISGDSDGGYYIELSNGNNDFGYQNSSTIYIVPTDNALGFVIKSISIGY